MKVGIVGLGKLGLPVAVSIDLKGHDVMGYDLCPERMSKAPHPELETGPNGVEEFNPYLERSNLKFGSLEEVLNHAEILFVAVQTPHDPQFEGTLPLPPERKDFNYTHLRASVKEIAKYAPRDKMLPVCVISTCLPGTMRREIMPLLPDNLKLVYNPFFIAMGTVMRDFLDPEFVLVGVEDENAAWKLIEFYDTLCDAPVARMSIESAELTKVCYNTFISMKIGFANTVMEFCHNIPNADCDSVIDALSMAHRRIISPLYMRGGMGDGGGCHPRDNIAMSWLCKKTRMSCNPFEDIMEWREKQTEKLALLATYYQRGTGLPIVLLGAAFKPETNITTGSPALLLHHMLSNQPVGPQEKVLLLDSSVDGQTEQVESPSVFVISCRHERYRHYKFPKGSIVIDPHRIIPDQAGVKVYRLGEG